MSSKVLALKSGIAASHVPETVLLFCIRADQVPLHPPVDFRADQVPSRTTWLRSLKSVQEPLAAFLLLGRTRANHRPWKTWLAPAVAVQLPCRVEEGCWAKAQKGSSIPAAKTHFFAVIPPHTLMKCSPTAPLKPGPCWFRPDSFEIDFLLLGPWRLHKGA